MCYINKVVRSYCFKKHTIQSSIKVNEKCSNDSRGLNSIGHQIETHTRTADTQCAEPSPRAHLMSTSLKVVSMAQVFWASFSLWAILSRMRFIFTCRRRTEEGPGGAVTPQRTPPDGTMETPPEVRRLLYSDRTGGPLWLSQNKYEM